MSTAPGTTCAWVDGLAFAERRPELSDLHWIVRGFGRPVPWEAGVRLPVSVGRAMERFLACGVWAHALPQLSDENRREERLLALSCKVRGPCSSCGAKSMPRPTELIMGNGHVRVRQWVLSLPVRQWVLSLPFELRAMVSVDRELQNGARPNFIEEVSRFYGADPPAGDQAGAIWFTQRFGASVADGGLPEGGGKKALPPPWPP